MNHIVDLREIRCANTLRQFPQTQRVLRDLRAIGRFFNQLRAFQRFGVQVCDAGLELFPEFIAPTSKAVRPGFHGIFVHTDFVERTNAAPAIVIDKAHRRFGPTRFAECAPFQRRRHNVVTVSENVGLDREIVADDTFHGITSAID